MRIRMFEDIIKKKSKTFVGNYFTDQILQDTLRSEYSIYLSHIIRVLKCCTNA